ncbi:MAG: tetratricopeptide repeat protein [Acidobacteriota bacterium]|nr:tetratricopeptide repeat protein [Acidobacteriota bacterium]
MKTKVIKSAPAPPRHAWRHGWHPWWLGLAALICAFEIYSPGINGPFVFDDLTLPFGSSQAADFPFRAWLGVRPLLMISYWLNYRLSGESTFSYHAVNVLLHAANSILVFWIVRRLLEWAAVATRITPAKRRLLALFAAAFFLFHPVATEAVTYIAGRSETLSVLFFFSTFTIFLYRRSQAISWPVSASILILFAAAINTKEHTAVLPLIFLLTDYFWNPGFSLTGIKRNWRLYVPLAALTLAGVLFLLRYLSSAPTIGFHIKDLAWHEYFFTECRAFFVYLRLFLLPFGQNVDYDFPISRTIFDRGAIFALLGIVILAGAAIYFRRRFPLASYGFLMSVILFAPTSSFVPIADVLVERRLYLPFIGLLLISIEFLNRVQWDRKTLATVLASICLVMGFLTYRRNGIWSSALALERDAVEKSPRSARAHEQLGFAYFFEGRCAEAATEYETAAKYQKPTYMLYLDWGVALDCKKDFDRALGKLRAGAAIQATAQVYAAIGRVLSRQGKWDESLAALKKAESLDPSFARTYIYRGAIHQDLGQLQAAESDYHLALHYDPRNENARDLLMRLEADLNTRRNN